MPGWILGTDSVDAAQTVFEEHTFIQKSKDARGQVKKEQLELARKEVSRGFSSHANPTMEDDFMSWNLTAVGALSSEDATMENVVSGLLSTEGNEAAAPASAGRSWTFRSIA